MGTGKKLAPSTEGGLLYLAAAKRLEKETRRPLSPALRCLRSYSADSGSLGRILRRRRICLRHLCFRGMWCSEEVTRLSTKTWILESGPATT